MAGLLGTPANNTYAAILNVATGTTATGLTGSLQTVYDGLGNASPLQLSTAAVNITSFTVNGQAISLANSFTTAGNFPIILTATGSTNVTLPTSGTLLTSASTITSLGTVTVGTWQATVIGSTYGGTGVNNGSSTITLGGNLTTSGAFTTTLTATANTNVTLPTSGTLATTGVTTLSSLTSASSLATIGTVTSGTWNGTVVTGQYGGTGVANTGKTITLGGNLTTSGAFTTTLTVTANTSVTLPVSGTLSNAVNAVKSDQTTGTSTTVYVTPAVQQNHNSAVKFWVNFVDNSGTITVNGSYNVTSVVRTGAGQYAINITTAFTTANWIPMICCKDSGSGAASVGIIESIAAGTLGINTINPSTLSASNTSGCYVAGVGIQ